MDRTFEILEAMDKEKSHWWSFITSGTKSANDGYGLPLTKRLRKKIKEAVEELNVELKKELESL